MSPEERENRSYLGDGVYIESVPNGIILRTGDHRNEHCTHVIYLEHEVLTKLFNFINELKERVKNE